MSEINPNIPEVKMVYGVIQPKDIKDSENNSKAPEAKMVYGVIQPEKDTFESSKKDE